MTEYPPKDETGNDNHQITVTSRMSDIPDSSYSYSTSDYEASWTVDLGSMYAPSSMSAAEKKRYGVEMVSQSDLNVDLASYGVEKAKPVYRATNPPVKATLDD